MQEFVPLLWITIYLRVFVAILFLINLFNIPGHNLQNLSPSWYVSADGSYLLKKILVFIFLA